MTVLSMSSTPTILSCAPRYVTKAMLLPRATMRLMFSGSGTSTTRPMASVTERAPAGAAPVSNVRASTSRLSVFAI